MVLKACAWVGGRNAPQMEMEGCIGFCRVDDALIYICVYTVCTVRLLILAVPSQLFYSNVGFVGCWLI